MPDHISYINDDGGRNSVNNPPIDEKELISNPTPVQLSSELSPYHSSDDKDKKKAPAVNLAHTYSSKGWQNYFHR